MIIDYEKNALKLDEDAEKIWNILGSENEIISKKALPKHFNLEDHIILTRDMERARDKVISILNDLLNQNQNQNLLYIADTGGSKTQFVHLIIDLIESKPKFEKITIIPTFNGYYDIEELFNLVRMKITKKIFTLDIEGDTTHCHEQLDEIHKEFQHKIEIRENINLIRKDIDKLKTHLSDQRDTEGLRQVKEIKKMISSMPSSPSANLFPLLKRLMKFGKDSLGLAYYFIIDETDQWFEANDFKEEFIEMDSFYRELFSLGLDISHSFLFLATNVVTSIIERTHYNHIASISRLKKIFANAEHISIPINYIGEDLDNILKYIHGLYQARRKKNKINKELLKEIKLLMEQSIDWSKRDINSKVIKLMNLYDAMKASIEDGIRRFENEKRNVECGGIFEEMFIKVFNKYGVGKIQKISQIVGDIPYGQVHNLDYLIIYGNNDGRCWGEAKYTNTSDNSQIVQKLHQVITGLFAISLETIEKNPIWYFIFDPYIEEIDLIDIVKNELNKYKDKLSSLDQENPEKLLQYFKPVLFKNVWSIAPLLGGTMRLTTETEIHNLKLWFDEFSDFGNKIPLEWYGISQDVSGIETSSTTDDTKDDKKLIPKLSIQEETLVKILSAYKKIKEKGNWKVSGKRSSSFKEFLSDNLKDYLDAAISIGKESGVLIQGGGYLKLGDKFTTILIQNSIGELQKKVRKFLLDRIKQSSIMVSQI
ncbi:MAG: hypothetical protein ACFFG0_24220 [Candidatus Thorarchaeota archaeon]